VETGTGDDNDTANNEWLQVQISPLPQCCLDSALRHETPRLWMLRLQPPLRLGQHHYNSACPHVFASWPWPALILSTPFVFLLVNQGTFFNASQGKAGQAVKQRKKR